MKKKILAFWFALMLLLGVFGCGKVSYEDSPKVRVIAIKGPTGMGIVKLMEDNEAKTTKNMYEFTLTGTPDDVAAKITSGEVDVAAVPVNLAAALYNKTGGEVKLAAINTLGVLYILDSTGEIKTVADLKGKTLYATGMGSTPEYVLNFVLRQNGIDPEKDITIEYKAEHAELATLAAAGEVSVAMLPEPNVTTVLSKNSNMKVALDLTKEWKNSLENSENAGSELAMGVIIVRSEFLNENKEAFNNFLEEYKASTEYVNNNVKDAAALIEKQGIIPQAALAEAALPKCNITYIDGDAMKEKIQKLYDVLFEANPKSIGGTLPGDNFYYKK